jgi:hypothetical protein
VGGGGSGVGGGEGVGHHCLVQEKGSSWFSAEISSNSSSYITAIDSIHHKKYCRPLMVHFVQVPNVNKSAGSGVKYHFVSSATSAASTQRSFAHN